MHQVGLTQTNATINKQRIVYFCRRFGYSQAGSVSQLVVGTYYKGIKRIFCIGSNVFAGRSVECIWRWCSTGKELACLDGYGVLPRRDRFLFDLHEYGKSLEKMIPRYDPPALLCNAGGLTFWGLYAIMKLTQENAFE